MRELVYLIVTIGAGFAYLPEHGNIPDADIRNGDPTPNAFYLGDVGNKSFYVQRWGGNWTDSKALCESMGMTLASIQTVEERDFLGTKYEYAVFWGWHWTAARDAHTAEQLRWHYNEEDIAVSLLLPWVPAIPDALDRDDFLTCGTYYIDENTTGMAFHNCSKLNGHVLCQQVV